MHPQFFRLSIILTIGTKVLTRGYDVKNARPLLVADFVRGPAAEGAVINFTFRRVTGHAHRIVGKELLGRQRREMR